MEKPTSPRLKLSSSLKTRKSKKKTKKKVSDARVRRSVSYKEPVNPEENSIKRKKHKQKKTKSLSKSARKHSMSCKRRQHIHGGNSSPNLPIVTKRKEHRKSRRIEAKRKGKRKVPAEITPLQLNSPDPTTPIESRSPSKKTSNKPLSLYRLKNKKIQVSEKLKTPKSARTRRKKDAKALRDKKRKANKQRVSAEIQSDIKAYLRQEISTLHMDIGKSLEDHEKAMECERIKIEQALSDFSCIYSEAQSLYNKMHSMMSLGFPHSSTSSHKDYSNRVPATAQERVSDIEEYLTTSNRSSVEFSRTGGTSVGEKSRGSSLEFDIDDQASSTYWKRSCMALQAEVARAKQENSALERKLRALERDSKPVCPLRERCTNPEPAHWLKYSHSLSTSAREKEREIAAKRALEVEREFNSRKAKKGKKKTLREYFVPSRDRSISDQGGRTQSSRELATRAKSGKFARAFHSQTKLPLKAHTVEEGRMREMALQVHKKRQKKRSLKRQSHILQGKDKLVAVVTSNKELNELARNSRERDENFIGDAIDQILEKGSCVFLERRVPYSDSAGNSQSKARTSAEILAKRSRSYYYTMTPDEEEQFERFAAMFEPIDKYYEDTESD